MILEENNWELYNLYTRKDNYSDTWTEYLMIILIHEQNTWWLFWYMDRILDNNTIYNTYRDNYPDI